MTMINIHCASENQRIPLISGWIGFNILLLLEQIPARSNIGYLPVVNGNQTQLITLNAVFLKSLAIADELKTQCILLIFDLAFYAKVHHVRWNDAFYMQRTIVWLGAYIPAYNFSMSLEGTPEIF